VSVAPNESIKSPDAVPKPEHYAIRDVTNPRGFVRVIRDHWWWCLDGDPTRAVIYVGKKKTFHSPQCNSHRSIVERIAVPFESAVVCHVPLAFVTADRDQ
jgi:hypothetical protein